MRQPIDALERSLLRPCTGLDVELPADRVSRQPNRRSGEDERLEHVGRQIIVLARSGGVLIAVPMVAPIDVNGPLPAGDGNDPRALAHPSQLSLRCEIAL